MPVVQLYDAMAITEFLLKSLGPEVDAAKWGWRSNEENATIKNEVEIDASASAATKINSDSIRDITHSQQRFVLYNSRRLTGECRKSFCLVVPLLLCFLWLVS